MAGRESLQVLDAAIADARPEDVPEALTALSLEEWGRLLLDIPADLPNLRARFPSMPPDSVQDHWTGTHGEVLLGQSVAFVSWLVAAYEAVGRPMRDARVLDFGCGWGRLMRLLCKYVPAGRLYGVDPDLRSINICRDYGVLGELAVSDWVPRTLPVSGAFDLIYAFSVFTHLSEKTARVAFETLRRNVRDEGLLAITVRPPEFWERFGRPELIAEHDTHGFAFVPLPGGPLVDGDITYGDTSMTAEFITRTFPFWRVADVQTRPVDPHQTYVLLAPA